jgi:hypothetical protein
LIRDLIQRIQTKITEMQQEMQTEITGQSDLFSKYFFPSVERVSSSEDDGNFDKFGGIPSFYAVDLELYDDNEKKSKEEIDWPDCYYCKKPMQFFFQLTDPFKKKTFQMFKCLGKLCNYETISNIDYEKCLPISSVVLPPEISESIKKYSYNFYTDDMEQYFSNWINYRYTGGEEEKNQKFRPYQCFKVSRWDQAEELTNLDTSFFDEKLSQGVPCFCGHKINVELEKKSDAAGDEIVDSEDDCIVDNEIQEHYPCYSKYFHKQMYYGLKFGGCGPSLQTIDYSEYSSFILHFGSEPYLPYMWGDAGTAHIDYNLELKWDCS